MACGSVIFSQDGKKLVKFPCDWQGEYDIPNGVETIGERAFEGCQGLTSVAFPDSVYRIKIEKYAFSGCTGLSSLTFRDSIDEIGGWAFKNCSNLISVDLPWRLIRIEDGLFDGCTRLRWVSIPPDGIVSVGAYAFCNCRSLESVTISGGVATGGKPPSCVASIGVDAFKGCGNLKFVAITSNATFDEDGMSSKQPLDAFGFGGRPSRRLSPASQKVQIEDLVKLMPPCGKAMEVDGAACRKFLGKATVSFNILTVKKDPGTGTWGIVFSKSGSGPCKRTKPVGDVLGKDDYAHFASEKEAVVAAAQLAREAGCRLPKNNNWCVTLGSFLKSAGIPSSATGGQK